MILFFVLGAVSALQLPSSIHRRSFVGATLAAPVSLFAPFAKAATTPPLSDDVTSLGRAIEQLEAVRPLIVKESWDAIRAALTKPPLSDVWAKNSPFLKAYLASVEENDGDGLAVLDATEDAISHLRYLDMSAYNNVFNPIGSEGTTGATKELIRSYYEDPKNELDASVKALAELKKLGEL